MLDTVVLTLTADDFAVTNPAAFGPPIPLRGGGARRCQNATALERRRYVTRPALTWSRRSSCGSLETLRLEFSVPKFYLGSNLAEVTDSDLPGMADMLADVLSEMGVSASPENLMTARVSKVHYSKNIPLPIGTKVSAVLWTLRRLRASGRKDQRDSDWENGGEGYRLRTTHEELALYDKLRDVKKAGWSPKRSRDPLSGGLPLGDVSSLPAGAEVLRVEARLNVPRVLRAALLRVGRPNEDPRLHHVFSDELARAVLLDKLKLFPKASAATNPEATPDELYGALLSEGVKPDFALKVLAVAMLERSVTPVGLRNLLRDHAIPDTFWYGLKRLRLITTSGSGGQDVLELLRKAVQEFKPIRVGHPQSGSITAAVTNVFHEIQTRTKAETFPEKPSFQIIPTSPPPRT